MLTWRFPKIYESSSFSNEAGAAIHLAPNALRCLRYINVDEVALQGVPCYCVRVVLPDGKEIIAADAGLVESQYKVANTDWQLAHRADLHKCIKEAALSKEAGGAAPVLKLASKITKIVRSALFFW